MKKIFYLIALITFSFIFSASAQTKVYSSLEVDSAAKPKGGWEKFKLYLEVNQKYPYMALVDKKSGRVSIQAVVDTSGQVIDVKIVRGVDPYCDQEAKRLVERFNTWQPAIKNGKTVTQSFIIQVVFNLPTTEGYHYKGYQFAYFNESFAITTDSLKARYRWVKPVDSLGRYNGDQTILDLKTNKTRKLSLIKKYLLEDYGFYNNYGEIKQDSATHYRIEIVEIKEGEAGIKGEDVSTYSLGGKLVSTKWNNSETEIQYHQNGLVKSVSTGNNYNQVVYSWFNNGQFEGLKESQKVLEYWTKGGSLSVSNGNGYAEILYDQKIEKGTFVNGLRNGKFSVREEKTDTLLYEEIYNNGALITSTQKKDQVFYQVEKIPEFPGGLHNLGPYIGKYLIYPVQARKLGIQGRVTITFVVEKDGSISEVKALRGIGSGCDEEAIRIVQNMPRWKPGMQNGKPVRVQFSLPIMFRL